jgi:hypothetical protein
VYTTTHKKQIVVTGASNENFIIIEQGLKEGDEIYLSLPENRDKFKLVGEELITVLQERERLKREKQDNSKRPEDEPKRPIAGKRRKQ